MARTRYAPGFTGSAPISDEVVESFTASGPRAMMTGPQSFSPVERFTSQKEKMEEAARGRMARERLAGGLYARDEAPLANAAKAEMAPDSYYGDMTISGRLADAGSATGLLARGAKGGRVKQAQRLLQSLNYGVPGEGGKLSELVADGDYGKNTEAAVKALQKDVGLKPDGIIGEDTIGKMLEAFNESVQKQYRDQNPATEQPRILRPMEEYDKVFKRPVVQAEEEIDETVQKA